MLAPTDLALALDPPLFAAALGFTTPDPWQVAALRWTGRRALWNIARQSGKSTVAALIGLHTALYKPNSLTLLISPSLRQSSELFRKVSDWRRSWPIKWELPEDNKLSCTLTNGSRIVSLPSSEATIRGFSGVDLIIEDEAARVPDELYFAVRPMLAVSGGRLIQMSTPFGRMGHFYETWTNDDLEWEKVMVDASLNPRITPEFLESERRTMPDRVYRQEYMCEFAENEDCVFSLEDFDRAVTDDIKPLFGGKRP